MIGSTMRILCVFFLAGYLTSNVFAGSMENITIDLGDGLKMEFIKIPKGSFVQGSSNQQKARLAAGLGLQEIKLTKNFIIGKFEVTQAQYQKIMGQNPSYFVPEKTAFDLGRSDTSEHPVETVSWHDTIRFCNALSTQQGLTPCYKNSENSFLIEDGTKVLVNWDANGFRLPTVAEWTYCCRAGSTEDSPCGENNKETALGKYCWYEKNVNEEKHKGLRALKSGTQPVGTRLPNSWGLHDMLGNVCEWCWDPEETHTHQNKDYKTATGTFMEQILVDPKGIVTEDCLNRTYKGGCYDDASRNIGFDNEYYYQPDAGISLIGFRIMAIRENK